ncbi:MAG: cation diffusion facilitator family transporter [Pseudomonadales bacterium]|nr:cation diffusion facilitator family transporter [Pseudomonadales bacterium]
MPKTQDHTRLLKLAANASVVTALVLVAMKVVAVYMTSSVSVTASLVDSVMDIGASLVNLFAVRIALMPPDAEHRFGHGKAEPLAALAQSAFICGSALFLIFQALERFITPVEIKHLDVGIYVMIFSMVLTSALIMVQRYVIRKTKSTIIKADSLHYITDLLTNLSVLIALGIAQLGFFQVDILMGIAVGVFILYHAVGIGGSAVNMLMDRELERPEIEKIYDIVLQQDGILGVHDVRTRQSGKDTFIQLHLELNDDMKLIDAHVLADAVEANISDLFPDSEILIHQDPVGLVGMEVGINRRIKEPLNPKP